MRGKGSAQRGGCVKKTSGPGGFTKSSTWCWWQRGRSCQEQGPWVPPGRGTAAPWTTGLYGGGQELPYPWQGPLSPAHILQMCQGPAGCGHEASTDGAAPQGCLCSDASTVCPSTCKVFKPSRNSFRMRWTHGCQTLPLLCAASCSHRAESKKLEGEDRG